jgi:hypothetical protein
MPADPVDRDRDYVSNANAATSIHTILYLQRNTAVFVLPGNFLPTSKAGV